VTIPQGYAEPHSDKISQGYLPAYLKIAAELGPGARVCEIGVREGHSLRLWQALFPAGRITGVDIDPEAGWPEGTVRVVAAQDDPRLPELVDGGPFDLIVEDASHDGPLTAVTFGLLWPLVAPGGYYVAEDWWMSLHAAWIFDMQTDGGKMLAAVSGLLNLLDSQDAECDEITYRYGQAIVHKRKP
jgi:predicted O-methyltransferase YrrM